LAAALVTSLPSRYQVAPSWLAWAACSIVVAPMIAVTLAPTSVLWHRVERRIVFAFSAIAWAGLVLMIGRLVADMTQAKHDLASITLLESAVVIWTINILIHALLYWQLDRKGPQARASGAKGPADFHFAESGESSHAEEPHAWQPHFVDYLFLAFAASTSFAPPDYARPTSRRAKLLLMGHASISLVTLVLIASRAVATLT
jgi:hypothetical protein